MDIIEHVDDISLWAMDETGKRLESNNFRSWSLRGKPKVIEQNGSHKGINIIGATSILKDFDFIHQAYDKEETTITASHIIRFLTYLLEFDRHRGKNMSIVIMDNASIHRAKEVKRFALEHKEDLMIIYQPPYSPELNPQENIWSWMKRTMSQAMAIKNISELFLKLEEFTHIAHSNLEGIKNMVYARKFYK